MSKLTYDDLVKEVLGFRDEREWSKYHTIRNLSAALNIEASEIQELLLWKDTAEVNADLKKPHFRNELAGEVADVFMYLLFLCDASDIDILKAVKEKLEVNRKRFPTKDFKGTFSRSNRRDI